ncbi:MAG: hypothetical protein ABSE49_14435 [Polyangiaceae bacterium]
MSTRACLLSLAALAAIVLPSAACDRAPSTPMPQPEPVVAASAGTNAAPAPSAAPAASATPSASTTPIPAASVAAEPPPTASASPPPLPRVKVENIGMHIGGGPNDALNKAPIAESVAPHFDEVRACWAKVDDPTKGGDFGVDLLIQPEGGRAKVSNPRTAIHPAAFKDCVVAVFEQIDFKRNLKGLTMVSYSLRFTP